MKKKMGVLIMIGLIDIDSKIQNYALLKISAFYKSLGEKVELVSLPTCRTKKVKNIGVLREIAINCNKKYDKMFASVIFTRSQYIINIFKDECGDKIEFGGIGSFEPTKKLPPEIESMKPDYDLYTVEEIASRMTGIGTKEHKLDKASVLLAAGYGYTSSGCVRNCGFCRVPSCEGKFRQADSISHILNPKSNILVLHDNNFTADPYCIDKLHEIRDRKLITDINQGFDIRLINPDIAYALSEVKHLRSLHYAWDLMGFEQQVLTGINMLLERVPAYRHMCYVLTGYNTTPEEDMYRCNKLISMGIDPYIMVFDENIDEDERLGHFARWINSRIYKSCSFGEYIPWIKAQQKQIKFI